MGQEKRDQKVKSFVIAAKSSRFRCARFGLAFFSLSVFGFSSLNCSGPQKNNPEIETSLSTPKKTELGDRLTSQGNNSQVSFHSSGSRFLFVSSNRNSHTEKQVYEFDFKTQNERRVTFNDGVAQWPGYYQTNELVYSSNTDALKEYPPRLYKELHEKNWAPFDVYTSDLFGNGIKRWSEALEADTHPAPWKDSFVFLKQRPSAPDLQTASGKVLYRSTGRLLKVESAPKTNPIFILEEGLNSKNFRLLKIQEGRQDFELIYESKDILDFAHGKTTGRFLILTNQKILLFDPAKKSTCEVLKFSENQVQGVTWSPDEKTVILESNFEGSSHLYLWPLPSQPLGTCN